MGWLSFFFVFIAAASAAKKPCCFPSRYQAFTGDIGVDNKLVSNTTEEYDEVGFFAVDYPNKKLFYRTVDASTNSRMHVYQDFNIDMQYELFIVGGCAECKIKSIGRPLNPCINENATLLATTTFGYGTEILTVDEWEYPTDSNNGITFRIAVTDDCYPVIDNLFGMINGVRVERSQWIHHIRPFVDESIFKIPSFCQQMAQSGQRSSKRCNIPQHLLDFS